MSQLYSVGDRVVFSAVGCRAWGTQVLPIYNDVRNPNFLGLCEGVITCITDYSGQGSGAQSDSPFTNGGLQIATMTTAGVPVITDYITSYVTGQSRNHMVRVLARVENEDARRLLQYYAIPRVVARAAYLSMLRDLGRAIRGEEAVDFPLVDVEEIVAAAGALSVPMVRAPEKKGFTALMVEEPDLSAAFAADRAVSTPAPADPMQRIIDEVAAEAEISYGRLSSARLTSGTINPGAEVRVSPDWTQAMYTGSQFAQQSPEPPQAAYENRTSANVTPLTDPDDDDDYANDDPDRDDDEEAA